MGDLFTLERLKAVSIAKQPVRTGPDPSGSNEKAPDLFDQAGACGASRDAVKPNHMWSIITCPKPEHETCVAPSIRRAKS